MVIGDFGNTYLSVFKHIEDHLTNDGYIVSGSTGSVTLLDSYPTDETIKKIVFRYDSTGADDEIVLPVLSIEQGTLDFNDIEIGSNASDIKFRILLTLFAETTLQQQQITKELYDIIKSRHINFYDFDVDFENPPISGTLYVSDITLIPNYFAGTPNPALRHSIDINFTVSKII